MNDTLSIDLSSSWTNQDVTINKINKGGAPVLNYVSLWESPDNKSFYAYGGEQSYDLPDNQLPTLPPNELWQFTVDGKGGGSGALVTAPADSIFPSLTRQSAAIGASGNGVGYLLGGYSSSHMIAQFEPLGAGFGFNPIPGIVSYDMSSTTWNNNSAGGYST